MKQRRKSEAAPRAANPRRPRRPGNPNQEHARPAARLKRAIEKARDFLSVLKKGDDSALAEATMLQGILSGDVYTASIHVRQKLQRENLALRGIVSREKLKTERLKQQILKAAIPQVESADTKERIIERIKQIYRISQPPQISEETRVANAIAIREHDILEGRIIEIKPQKSDQPQNTRENHATLPQDEPPATGQGQGTPEKTTEETKTAEGM